MINGNTNLYYTGRHPLVIPFPAQHNFLAPLEFPSSSRSINTTNPRIISLSSALASSLDLALAAALLPGMCLLALCHISSIGASSAVVMAGSSDEVLLQRRHTAAACRPSFFLEIGGALGERRLAAWGPNCRQQRLSSEKCTSITYKYVPSTVVR